MESPDKKRQRIAESAAFLLESLADNPKYGRPVTVNDAGKAMQLIVAAFEVIADSDGQLFSAAVGRLAEEQRRRAVAEAEAAILRLLLKGTTVPGVN